MLFTTALLKTVNRVCLLRYRFSFVLSPEKEASVSEKPSRVTGIKVTHINHFISGKV